MKNLVANQKVEFPQIRYSKFNSDFTMFEIKAESGYNHFLNLENVCIHAERAGLISGFDIEGEYIECEVQKLICGWDEYEEKIEEYELLDWMGDLTLDECSRILKSYLECDVDGMLDDLPF